MFLVLLFALLGEISAEILKTDEVWNILGNFGLDSGSRISIDLSILEGTECSMDYPRALLI